MLRKRNAFLNQYKETSIFEKNLDEFDNSYQIVKYLIDEYKAIQTNDYINWGLKQHQQKLQQQQSSQSSVPHSTSSGIQPPANIGINAITNIFQFPNLR